MEQLNLQIDSIETFEYPERYRGYQFVASKKKTSHADRVGRFRAETWYCKVHGDGELDSRTLSMDDPRPTEAIARAMTWLDINLDGILFDSDAKRANSMTYYNNAIARIKECLAPSQPEPDH